MGSIQPFFLSLNNTFLPTALDLSFTYHTHHSHATPRHSWTLHLLLLLAQIPILGLIPFSFHTNWIVQYSPLIFVSMRSCTSLSILFLSPPLVSCLMEPWFSHIRISKSKGRLAWHENQVLLMLQSDL